jgi:hypothetical protein
MCSARVLVVWQDLGGLGGCRFQARDPWVDSPSFSGRIVCRRNECWVAVGFETVLQSRKSKSLTIW